MSDFSTWTPRPIPGSAVLEGGRARLEPLDWSQHGEGIFAAVGGAANTDIWSWMPVGPWETPEKLRSFLAERHDKARWRTLTIRDGASGEILGMFAFMGIREEQGSVEIGCVAFGPKLKRTAQATEALHLMARHVFGLGYRRYEWKCNRLNAASMRSAKRFGFTFEGVFRNDMVTKGQSRDTAWFSITDSEWPSLDAALRAWLAPANFAPDGSQIRTLESFR